MKASPLNLLDYYVTDLSFSVNKAYDYKKPSEFRLEDLVVEPTLIQVENAVPDSAATGKWQMRLRVRHVPAPDRNAPSQFMVELVGVFSVVSGYPADKIQTLLEVNGASLLYGAARQVVRSATAQGPHAPVMLPSVSFYPPKKSAAEMK